MSQHIWNTLDGHECMAGWDRPLQHFFFQIGHDCECRTTDPDGEQDCRKCHDSGTVWAYQNLDDKEASAMGGLTLIQVRLRMREHLTAYPDGIMDALWNDRFNNEGNKQVHYDPVGTVKA